MNYQNTKLTEIYTSAVAHHQKGDYKTAESLYKEILKELPNHINTQSNLGGLYWQIGQQDKAMHLLQNVLKIEKITFKQ